MKRNAEDRIYGGSTVGERRKVIDDIKEGMADMPAFDEQAKMESDYIKDRGSHFGHREDDPKGMLDVNKELTQFKKLSKAGWEGTDSVDLSGNLRKLQTSHVEVAKPTDMSDSQKQCIMAMKCGDLTDGKCGYCQSSGAYTSSNKKGDAPLTAVSYTHLRAHET